LPPSSLVHEPPDQRLSFSLSRRAIVMFSWSHTEGVRQYVREAVRSFVRFWVSRSRLRLLLASNYVSVVFLFPNPVSVINSFSIAM
jgi:hypothetical protein